MYWFFFLRHIHAFQFFIFFGGCKQWFGILNKNTKFMIMSILRWKREKLVFQMSTSRFLEENLDEVGSSIKGCPIS